MIFDCCIMIFELSLPDCLGSVIISSSILRGDISQEGRKEGSGPWIATPNLEIGYCWKSLQVGMIGWMHRIPFNYLMFGTNMRGLGRSCITCRRCDTCIVPIVWWTGIIVVESWHSRRVSDKLWHGPNEAPTAQKIRLRSMAHGEAYLYVVAGCEDDDVEKYLPNDVSMKKIHLPAACGFDQCHGPFVG